MNIPSEIFRAYDIRGVVDKQLNTDVLYHIGIAYAAWARELNQQTIIVGHDGRLSSPKLNDALISGLLNSGCDVIDIGLAPTPVVYYAIHTIGSGSGARDKISDMLNKGEVNVLKESVIAEDGKDWLIIDDLVDTGETIKTIRLKLPNAHYATVYAKPSGREQVDTFITEVSQDTWIYFPWDMEMKPAPTISERTQK